jgi:hypothetical protein
MSDSEIFRAFRFCKLTTEFRIILFHELVRRGRAANILLTKYFSDNGFKYDTEYRFVKREEEARAELTAPQPVPELGIGEAGDEEATTRETVEVAESTNQPETPKPEKKPCHMCGVRKERIEKLEKEILDLKQAKKDLKAANKSLKESLHALRKENKSETKKLDAAGAKLDKPSGTKRVGDKSEPYGGFYWEFRKAAKPYGIFATDTATYGTAALCECNSESEALTKIREYANDEAKTATA